MDTSNGSAGRPQSRSRPTWRRSIYGGERAAAAERKFLLVAFARFGIKRSGPWRFSHFRKTFGYANSPLDGIWLRAPYLHNGSVPTLRDLLNPSAERPAVFYRGYDVFDQKNVGFVSDPARFTAEGRTLDDPQQERQFFLFDTRERPGGRTPRERNEGNSNAGHEGPAYGTALTVAEKDAVVEYLKTF